jgi:catecholate siderophore receptor
MFRTIHAIRPGRRRVAVLPSPHVLAAAVSAGLLFPITVQAANAPAGDAVPLGPLRIEDQNANTQTEDNTLSRMPGTVQDTPQMINVITPEILQQQNVTTLDQALRNVPGITVTIGEGGGGLNGDQFRIRGFDPKDDIYVDGLRDFGVYTRDSFNYESIEVIKGPSSAMFGRGTTGGAINTQSKTPQSERFGEGSASIGTGPFYRATGDVNHPVTDTIGVRLNAMFQAQDMVDRDHVESRRWGIAPSIAFGIDTETAFSLGYLHQTDERQPDYGVPVVTRPGDDYGRPVTEFGVPRSKYFGFDKDHDNTDVDIFTGKFSSRLNDEINIFSDTRLGVYTREFTPSPASCNATCVTNFFDGDPGTVPLVTTGGPGPYAQDTWGMQNITAAVWETMLGSVRTQFVGGVDLSYQHNKRRTFLYTPSRGSLPARELFDPYFVGPYTIGPITDPAANERLETEGRNYAAFANARVCFTDEVSLVGGIRLESHDVDHATITQGGDVTSVEANSEMANPRASLVFERSENQTFYISWARSSVPQGTSIASAPTSVNASTAALEPELNEIWEAGAKINFLDGALGVSASVFQVTKNNAKQVDDQGDLLLQSGEGQRTKGIELALSGEILEGWFINANYTYLDSKILEAFTGTPPLPNAAVIGNGVPFVAKNAFSLWTTYDPAMIPGLQLGLGSTYRDSVYLNNTALNKAPYNLSFDTLISYQFDTWWIALNASNLADHLNYDGLWSNRAIPAAERTLMLSVAASL